ncbi:MAG: coproporphyrinogen dehydrogenase HemZ [Eubacteriaceae bacterium]|jgi:oxygen-independent coproporphyrinogen-3 oxidase|nr:coproporphyrinogen dehydrogenase HemZ [Eubacteriaceae bacterium]
MAPYTFDGSEAASHTMIDEVIALFPGAEKLDISIRAEKRYAEAAMPGKAARVPIRDESSAKSAKLALYTLLCLHNGAKRAWGAMTGVKPMKKYTELLDYGMQEEEAALFFRNCYGTSLSKIQLLSETYHTQKRVVSEMPEGCLYINIPLCPAKCLYCSFPSKIAEPGGSDCEAYVASLLYEMRALAPVLEESGVRFSSVYFGGGTPAILSESQASQLLEEAAKLAPGAREITFEAGRSDCVDFSKLALLRDRGVGRISLNPQTFREETAFQMGRGIPNRLFYAAYEKAKKLGFAINCDLIVGLPGEGRKDAWESLLTLAKLEPENITMHALCKKRASEMSEAETQRDSFDAALFQDEARRFLFEWGYSPYYLYKQKGALSHAENVGYAKRGKECLYNIAMMGEFSDVIGFGANASSHVKGTGLRSAKIYNIKDFILYNRDISIRTAGKIKKIRLIKGLCDK